MVASDLQPHVDEVQRFIRDLVDAQPPEYLRRVALGIGQDPSTIDLEYKRMDNRPGWDDYFFEIAEAVATRADCTRRQVGAVLVGPDRRVLSTGYNGAPPGVPGCASAGACPRGRATVEQVPSRSSYADGQGACIARHAEANAVDYSRPAVRAGATMYVTCEPCPQCYALLEACGITDIRWPEGTD